jgi:hypothetical protein
MSHLRMQRPPCSSSSRNEKLGGVLRCIWTDWCLLPMWVHARWIYLSCVNFVILPVDDCREIHEPTYNDQDETALVTSSTQATAEHLENDSPHILGEPKTLVSASHPCVIAKEYRLRWTCVSTYLIHAFQQRSYQLTQSLLHHVSTTHVLNYGPYRHCTLIF